MPLLLAFVSMLPFSIIWAATNVDATATITWPFTLSTPGQVPTFSTDAESYFSSNYVGIGSNITYSSVSSYSGFTFSRFQPKVQSNSVTAEDYVSFNLRPKTGLNFVPTSISFDCMRFGTDGGKIDIVWKSSDGTLTTLGTGISPNRNNNNNQPTHVSYDLTATPPPASTGEFALQVFIYSLGNTKQVGLANVVIAGKVSGEIANVTIDTLNISVSPAGAGSVSTFPVGKAFDRGTDVALTATKNFGYRFSHWAGPDGSVVSSENPYNVKLNGNLNLSAVFSAVNTYSLDVLVEGGASDYMVSASPAATIVEGKKMYEGGTLVTLSARNNPILTFTDWSTGETGADLSVTMNSDKTLSAKYSVVDYIVGWDFWKTGGGDRPADFYSDTDNQTSTLILIKEDGTTSSWLDKSQVAAGGYEGAPAAVNWKSLTDKYYYQISFNAKNYTNIRVKAAMLFNYNAYSVQRCEFSTDGTNFNLLGTYNMTSAKVWYDSTFTLPSSADHVEKVYIRWIPDYTSAVLGTTATNDGTSISGIYVFADASVFNDGVAPVLKSTVPAHNATGASATGRIVLTFDEKVKVADGTSATLGNKTLNPVISGKTITFAYSGLDYNTSYTFNLSGNKVSDLSGNMMTSPVSIDFKTISKPTVTKKKFDFVVGIDGDFKEALQAAKTFSSTGERFHIFFPDGKYDIGTLTGDANQMTTISIPKVSYIGQSSENVVLFNKSIQESINSTATMYFTSASSNVYMQDISLMNKMDYRTGTLLGRGVALWDQGNKNIYKNVKLLSNQDTYYTGGERSYLENCDIHGTVDFICGGGDILFNECLLYLEERSGNCLTAPATNSNWGYVFNNCTIDGFDINNGSYRLGRPWSNAPKCVYINTIMKKLPVSAGWGDPMNVVPAVFAEYNSLTSGGIPVDLSNRRRTYTKDATTVNLNPVLTSEQAAQYTIENVLGGSDAWQPKISTEQLSSPVITGNGNTISWENSDYVLCWGIFKDGKFVEFVIANNYTIPSGTANGTAYTIRAANEMGGLSASSNTYTFGSTGLDKNLNNPVILEKQYYTLDGFRVEAPVKGVTIVKTIYADGKVEVKKVLNLFETGSVR